jgi:hypothetical protein
MGRQEGTHLHTHEGKSLRLMKGAEQQTEKEEEERERERSII